MLDAQDFFSSFFDGFVNTYCALTPLYFYVTYRYHFYFSAIDDFQYYCPKKYLNLSRFGMIFG